MRNPFRRDKTEKRAITDVPWNVGAASVKAVSQERALSLIPVYAANRLLAGTVSTLPLKAYRKVGDERRPAPMPLLFRQMQDDGSIVPWLHQCMTSLGLRGNAYGLVVTRDGMQHPTQIVWLNPDVVAPDDRPGLAPGGWLVEGRRVEREDVLHIPWFLLPGSRVGVSPLTAFAQTISGGISASKFGTDWFDNGGVPPGTFQNTAQTVNQEQAEAIKKRLSAAIRTRQPLVYGNDWDFKAISVSPAEAQFIESQKLTATQIATIYGIPPEMIGGETGASMTYANVEQQQINFLMLTLRPWLVALESAFSAVLPERQYVRFNGDAVIRADVRTRWDTYKIARDIGVFSANDVLALEDRPPIPGGDDYTPSSSTAPTPAPGFERMTNWRIPS